MIVFVRHGETEPNREGRLLGRADPGLTETGRQQAEALAAVLGSDRPEAVVSSPLERCRATAEVIAASLGLEVDTDDRLIEVDYGEWEGMPFSEIPSAASARWRRDPEFRPPGGESLGEVADRVATWCAEQLHRDRPVVAVSHVSPIKAGVTWALGVAPTTAWHMFVGVASITRIATDPRGGTLVSFNERVTSTE